MGARGAAWAREEFAWDRLAERMHRVYQDMIDEARGVRGSIGSAARR
jgi:hypothetical protein